MSVSCHFKIFHKIWGGVNGGLSACLDEYGIQPSPWLNLAR